MSYHMINLSIYQNQPVSLPISLSIHLAIYLSIDLSICLPIYYRYHYPSIHPSLLCAEEWQQGGYAQFCIVPSALRLEDCWSSCVLDGALPQVGRLLQELFFHGVEHDCKALTFEEKHLVRIVPVKLGKPLYIVACYPAQNHHHALIHSTVAVVRK